MLDMANALRHDPEKPVFHVMPRHGWVIPLPIDIAVPLSKLSSHTGVPQYCLHISPCLMCTLLLQINDPNGPVFYHGKYHV